MWSRLAFRLLLAVLLVSAQHQAIVHGLEHAGASLVHTQPATPHTHACDQCIAFAGLDSPAAGALAVAAGNAEEPGHLPAPDAVAPDVAFAAAYASRAPPPIA
jgi:hypothetical protein